MINNDYDLVIQFYDVILIGERITWPNKACYTSTTYKPPEELTKCEFMDGKADMWNVGLVLGELLLGRPVVDGDGIIDQLNKVIRLCGVPPNSNLDWISSEIMKTCISTVHDGMIRKGRQCGRLKTRFADVKDDNILDLLQKLLVFDPRERLTAQEAIEHPLFNDLREQGTQLEIVGENAVVRPRYWSNKNASQMPDEEVEKGLKRIIFALHTTSKKKTDRDQHTNNSTNTDV